MNMSPSLKIALEQQGSISVGALVPVVGAAVQAALGYLQDKWQKAASVGIAGLKPTSQQDYIWGVQEGMVYPMGGNPMSGRIFNVARCAKWIEDGYPAFDMKPGLLRGPQARRSADGGRYNVVPFRWGTPRAQATEAGSGDQRATLKSMPAEIYERVKRFNQSRGLSSYLVAAWSLDAYRKSDDPVIPGRSGLMMGATRRVWTYKWGDRLKREDIPAHLLQPTQPHHRTSMYEGMVRMKADEGTRHTHSAYMTFRVVSDKSAPGSWMHPGQQPRPYSKAVLEQERENVVRLVKNMVKASVGIGGSGG